jgi:hypothetical protein
MKKIKLDIKKKLRNNIFIAILKVIMIMASVTFFAVLFSEKLTNIAVIKETALSIITMFLVIVLDYFIPTDLAVLKNAISVVREVKSITTTAPLSLMDAKQTGGDDEK